MGQELMIGKGRKWEFSDGRGALFESLIHFSNPQGTLGLETRHVYLPCEVVSALGLALLFLRNKLGTAFRRLVVHFRHSTYAFYITWL